MNNLDCRKQYILELKEKAACVKEKMGKYQKRRPVVIEFSGAPKSGKTSSINSLMQFLKRNGFKVKVLKESASVCPVKDKHSPMFNLWTACDTIKSLIGELESVRTQYDVIIIDRGILDAMCWFQWLINNGKMENRMKQIIDQFLSMDEIVSYIDIVFVYVAEPEVSIEREYASLLTDISGSIMNREVLCEYLEAVDNTVKMAQEHQIFRKVQSIDTSHKDQNEVGKEVTNMALQILEDMFEEQIGYIEPFDITKMFCDKHWISFDTFRDSGFRNLNIGFGLRSEVEVDMRYIQPVPIAVLKESTTDEVFVVKKPLKATGEHSQEKSKLLSYVGGHIRVEDKNSKNRNDFLEICKTTLKREVHEELGISISLDGINPDLIYVRDETRSDIHLAVCFLIKEKKETLKVRMDSGELMADVKENQSGKFVNPESAFEEGNTWSRIILKQYFHVAHSP